MRTKVLHISDINIDVLSNLCGQNSSKSTDAKEKLLKIMRRSMGGGLTKLQRFCVEEYYLNNRPQYQIAQDLGVAPSTVCRHINRALNKLKIIASYYN